MRAAAASRRAEVPVDRLAVSAYRVPTDRPESDGTARWESTTLVLVEIDAAGARGTGWSYASAAAATVVDETLAPIVRGANALDTRGLWTRMTGAVRNAGRSGIASYAIAAVDVALWDLRARLHGVALCDLIGLTRETVPAYGSGGFTSYDERALQEQLGGWAQAGFHAVKMKVGRDHRRDVARATSAREAIGPQLRAVRGRERRLQRYRSDRDGAGIRGARRHVVRAAGRSPRPRRHAPRARARAGGDGDRVGRVHHRHRGRRAGRNARSTCCKRMRRAAAATPACSPSTASAK